MAQIAAISDYSLLGSFLFRVLQVLQTPAPQNWQLFSAVLRSLWQQKHDEFLGKAGTGTFKLNIGSLREKLCE